jgi:hypothetical protein
MNILPAISSNNLTISQATGGKEIDPRSTGSA